MESSGFYGVHLANYLLSSNLLAPFSICVYCLNPNEVNNYKKSFNNIGKNNRIDSLVISGFARVGRFSIKPWRGSQHLVLQLLTRHRMHITDPDEAAKIVLAAARNSYKLDKCLYEPLTISIAASFNCISSFEEELKAMGKAILQIVQGLNLEEYNVLNSIPGIGNVYSYSAGILSEIGSIKVLQSTDSLAKYCGIVWNNNDSSDFES